MANVRLGEVDLKNQLDDIGDRFPKLARDNLFIVWFLRAFLTDDLDSAADALSGGANDKGVDALLRDRTTKRIFIVQGKYRELIGHKREARSDVVAFADIAVALTGERNEFRDWIDGTTPEIEEKLKEYRSLIRNDGYAVRLYYATTGAVSGKIKDEATNHMKRTQYDAMCHVMDGARIRLLLSDYLDGVAPPVPTLDLEIESSSRVRTEGSYQRYDSQNDIDSWVFSMPGEAVGDLYRVAGDRLFARNVRGFLGSTKINQGMATTIKTEPDFFWYYNNGITIICDAAEERGSRGKAILRVENPQVINGQQTTRTLAKSEDRARRTSVLVRVVRVSRDATGPDSKFNLLVSRIVSATNWQNAIRPSDLMSNDRTQIEIQRQLRKLEYWYIRKRQTKGEARRKVGGLRYEMIQKYELAQAVAGCELDPSVIRSGRERLFEERWYSIIFPNSDPFYYLPRYWLMRTVSSVARGHPERAYAKWLVLNFMWSKVRKTIRGRTKSDLFRRACERKAPVIDELDKSITSVFVASLNFYRANRGRGSQAIDVSKYFARKNLDGGFTAFWPTRENSSRGLFNTRFAKFEKEFSQYDGT